MKPTELRSWMREVPSPVTVVTIGHPEPRGATIGSFTSTSLEPPLISFNVQAHSRFHAALLEAPCFAVHLLHEQHRPLAEHFARPGLSSEDQFADIPVRYHASGLPLLEEAPHVLICRPYAHYPAGDHTIVVGEVIEGYTADGNPPLVYFRQRYHTVRPGTLIPSESP